MNIRTIADLITEDPNFSFDTQHLQRRYSDRALSIDIGYSSILNESEIPNEFDTVGDLDHDYPLFINSLLQNRDNLRSLTLYSKSDYANKGAKLYKLKGINAGFAVTGDGDIISVHNSEPKSSPFRGIGRHLVKLAKEMGGRKLDHFDFPKLNEIYSSEGFKEYERVPWDDRYAPDGWDYQQFGKPDLVFRSL